VDPMAAFRAFRGHVHTVTISGQSGCASRRTGFPWTGSAWRVVFLSGVSGADLVRACELYVRQESRSSFQTRRLARARMSAAAGSALIASSKVSLGSTVFPATVTVLGGSS